MTNVIIGAVSKALEREFGENCRVMTEGREQDLRPFFYISCKEASLERFPGGRYRKCCLLNIRYFPLSENANAECLDKAEKMLWCLEEISVEDDLLHGSDIRYEIEDGVLNFSVAYNCFVRKRKRCDPMEEVHSMEEMRSMEEVHFNLST